MQKSYDWNTGYTINMEHLTIIRKIRFTVKRVCSTILLPLYYHNNVSPDPRRPWLLNVCIIVTQGCVSQIYLRIEIVLMKHSLHEKQAALVLPNLFMDGT